MGHAAGGETAAEVTSFRDNLRVVWRLRDHFAAYLLPAAALLLLALAQANLALTATTAGQRVIDEFAATRDGAPVPPIASQFGSELLFNAAAPPGTPAPRLALLMATFALVAVTLGIGIEYLRSVLQERFRHRLQAKLLAGFTSELAPERARRDEATNNRIFTEGASQLSGLLIFQLVGWGEQLFKAGVYGYGLVRIRPGGALIAGLAVGTVLFQIAVAGLFAKRLARVSEDTFARNMELRSRAQEFFDGLAKLVYFRGEQAYAKRLLHLARASEHASRRHQMVAKFQEAAMELVTTLSLPLIVALLSLPVLVVAGGPGITAGTIMQAQLLLILMTATTAGLVAIGGELSHASPSVRRVEEILRIPLPGEAPPELATLRARQHAPGLEVSALTFQYAGTGAPALRDVSFAISRGACVGLIGGTGSGKSTLARVLVGDLRPASGRILYDDVVVTDWHLWWKRELIGYLPAEQGFMRGTLEENVLFGRSLEDVQGYQRALQISGVAAIAEAKASEGGMKTWIDRAEDVLSSGERRRVGIARLLVGDQRLWILDEPGSGLDPKTMGDLATGLRPGSAVLRGRTTLIITHDPDVFRTDFNMFLENGTIAATGTHEELLQRLPAYAALVRRHVHEREDLAVSPT